MLILFYHNIKSHIQNYINWVIIYHLFNLLSFLCKFKILIFNYLKNVYFYKFES